MIVSICVDVMSSFLYMYYYNILGGSLVRDSCQQSLVGVANLLGLEVNELKRSLTSRVMTTTKGGAVGTIIK